MLATLKTRLLAVALVLLASAGAWAAPVTYRFTGDISGTLAGVPVAGMLTLNVTGDTDDLILTPPAQRLTQAVATFGLSGSGSFEVTNTFYVFARPDLGWTGFGVNGLPNCCDIIQIHNPGVLLGYDLHDSIGPVTSPSNFSLAAFHDVPTTAGLFSVNSMTNNTFEAIVAATVPEPGVTSLVLLAGAAGVLARRFRRGTGPALDRRPGA